MFTYRERVEGERREREAEAVGAVGVAVCLSQEPMHPLEPQKVVHNILCELTCDIRTQPAFEFFFFCFNIKITWKTQRRSVPATVSHLHRPCRQHPCPQPLRLSLPRLCQRLQRAQARKLCTLRRPKGPRRLIHTHSKLYTSSSDTHT